MKDNSKILLGIVSCSVAIVIVCSLCVPSALGAYFYFASRSTPVAQATELELLQRPSSTPAPVETAAAPLNTPVLPPTLPTPTIAGSSVLPAMPAVNSEAETKSTLENTIVPINDPIDLAKRLQGKQNLPRSLEFPVEVYQVGDRRSFWVTNSETNQNSQVDASLAYVTDHVYFWVEDGVQYDNRDLKALVETFENQIYPRNREFFGSEWTPGVDADPRLYILYARGLGGSVAGYYSSADQYLPVVRQDSNGHEMFLFSADHVDLDEEFAYGVLAHEFQHMIHWYGDRNEETWMNEGFADLAMFLNDYSIGGADRAYVQTPDIQLNDWPSDPPNRAAHYGAAFLFLTYFLDRFGEEATQALVAEPANGMVSIDKMLDALGAADGITGKAVGADDIFADWVVATFLQDKSVADGRYTYHNYPGAPAPDATEEIEDCPAQTGERDVSQYGVDYVSLKCRGDYILRFQGAEQVGVLPVQAHSGAYMFYSNQGDESDMTLTRAFDFTDYSGPLTLTYWTWYDLEQDYDYLYLTASLDGENWQILSTPSGTANNPVGNSYGWGYNGLSGGGPAWIQEQVDISQFAGQQVQIRFEYVTDAAVNGEGFLLDDVAVPEAGYFSDFENDDGGWSPQGFARIQNSLQQTFRLSLIRLGRDTTVEQIELPEGNLLEIPITIGGNVKEIILAISGTTRYTRQDALYDLSILPR
jgi:immune inhibitor A